MDIDKIILIGAVVYFAGILFVVRKEKKFLISWIIASIFQILSIYCFFDISKYITSLSVFSTLDTQAHFWVSIGIIIVVNMMLMVLANCVVFFCAEGIKEYQVKSVERKKYSIENVQAKAEEAEIKKNQKLKLKQEKEKQKAELKEVKDKERAKAQEAKEKERAELKEVKDKERAELREVKDKERAKAQEAKEKERAKAQEKVKALEEELEGQESLEVLEAEFLSEENKFEVKELNNEEKALKDEEKANCVYDFIKSHSQDKTKSVNKVENVKNIDSVESIDVVPKTKKLSKKAKKKEKEKQEDKGFEFEIADLTLSKVKKKEKEETLQVKEKEDKIEISKENELNSVKETTVQEIDSIEVASIEETKTLELEEVPISKLNDIADNIDFSLDMQNKVEQNNLTSNQEDEDLDSFIQNLLNYGNKEDAERYLRMITYYSEDSNLARKAQNILSEMSSE